MEGRRKSASATVPLSNFGSFANAASELFSITKSNSNRRTRSAGRAKRFEKGIYDVS